MLRPSETVQKLLLSTPAHFVAEYEADDVVVTHAWRMERQDLDPQSILHRTFLVLSFTTPEVEKVEGALIPDYTPTGELTAALMAVLYGKRFDHHGPVEMTGQYHVPDLARANDLCDPGQPYHSSKPRADYPLPLDLRELGRFRPILEAKPIDVELSAAFSTAALFYSRALRTIYRDPEVAYLHLITALERLAEVAPLEHIEHEASIRTALARIERELEGGERVAKLFRHRMRQLKRRFVGLITTHLDGGFFARTESEKHWGGLTANAFPRAAAAAYDLRSRYVHTGAHFGGWIAPRPGNPERQLGTPRAATREWSVILERAPTFVGLERITRFILLNCAARLGGDLERLFEPAPPTDSASGKGGAHDTSPLAVTAADAHLAP